TRRQIFPRRPVAGLKWPRHRRPLEQRELPRLGEYRVGNLLGVAIEIAEAVSVHPAAAVAAWRDVLEVADDLETFVLLQMLVGGNRIARLGAGINTVENFRLALQVIARTLKMLIPVRKF